METEKLGIVATEPLRTQIKRVHEARGGLAVLKQAVDAARLEFEAKHAELFKLTQNAQETLSAEEDTLRMLAVESYLVTKNKQPAPGVTIRLVKKVEYDPRDAFDWAKKFGMALILDKKGFEKIALATPVPCVTIREEPHAQLATDLREAVQS